MRKMQDPIKYEARHPCKMVVYICISNKFDANLFSCNCQLNIAPSQLSAKLTYHKHWFVHHPFNTTPHHPPIPTSGKHNLNHLDFTIMDTSKRACFAGRPRWYTACISNPFNLQLDTWWSPAWMFFQGFWSASGSVSEVVNILIIYSQWEWHILKSCQKSLNLILSEMQLILKIISWPPCRGDPYKEGHFYQRVHLVIVNVNSTFPFFLLYCWCCVHLNKYISNSSSFFRLALKG